MRLLTRCLDLQPTYFREVGGQLGWRAVSSTPEQRAVGSFQAGKLRAWGALRAREPAPGLPSSPMHLFHLTDPELYPSQ